MFDVPVLVVVAFRVAFIGVELVGNPLQAARRRVRRAFAEPVWHVDVLVSIQPGARAPVSGGQDRSGALTMRSWGHAAVLVRPGAPYGADVESIGWPNRKGLPP